MTTNYDSTLASVSEHQVPDWFNDAKFGIFIHWSPSSIPAYAPVHLDMAQLLMQEGERAMFANTPYAEWYLNSLTLEGSPAHKHHLETYGADFNYDKFGEEFNIAIQAWQPDEWAKLFKQIQAKYVVLVTKHHDGFTLFKSDIKHPHKENWYASRDIVGELNDAVKAQDIKMGLYYSGSLDWSFLHEPIDDFRALVIGGSPEQEYIDYVDAQYRELIDRYKPAVLWNDIGYPPKTNIFDLFAYYYNKVPDGVVNDRWIQIPARGRWILRLRWVKKFISWLVTRKEAANGIEPPPPPHSDYATPEYTVKEEISERKWECVRGIGKSFGYNAEEDPSDYLSREELIQMLIDIVSKNGNLLLNIGPKPDGSIPEVQIDRLEALGQWLAVNGSGIFETRPWFTASSKTSCGLQVRFTQNATRLFVFILGKPAAEDITIQLDAQYMEKLPESANKISLLGCEVPVTLTVNSRLTIKAQWLESHGQCISWQKA